MRMKEFARLLAAAKRDRTGRYQQTFTTLNGGTVLCESKGEHELWSHFSIALTDGAIDSNRWSIRETLESLVPDGREIVDSWNPRYGGAGGVNLALLEASGQVDTAAFSNITGQIIYNEVMKRYMDEAFVFSSLIRSVPTSFNGEKIAGIAELGDNAEVVGEGQPYPTVGLTEDWIETPQTTKRGMIVPVTKEAVFFDRTGLVLERARDVGKWLGVNKEKRAIDSVIDENSTAHRYRWKGTTYATFQATTPWVNVKTSNALVDWTDVDGVEQVMNGLVDPNTEAPIMLEATHLICTKQLEQTAYRILNATEVAATTPGFATSGNPNEARIANPYRAKYQLLSSKLLAGRLATDTDWFLGNPAEAVRYMENWPLAVVQAPANAPEEFSRDIVAQFKASERGAFVVVEPRLLVKSSA